MRAQEGGSGSEEHRRVRTDLRAVLSRMLAIRAYAVGGVDTPVRHVGGQLTPTTYSS